MDRAVDVDTRRTGSVIGVRLRQHGVETVFGLMGDDTAELAAALPGSGIRFVCARHENSAVAMAVGGGWAESAFGVCLLSRGPGLTNGMTALVDAVRGNQGLVVLTGDEATTSWSPGRPGPDHKALAVDAIAAATGLELVRPGGCGDVVDAVDRAVAHARAGRVVLLSVPKDVLIGEAPSAPTPPPSWEPSRVAPDEAELRAAAALIDGAERPLVLVGHGAWRAGAGEAIGRLADRVGAAVATTLLAQHALGEHPFHVGVVGSFSHTAGRRVIEQADLVIAIGASLNRYTTAHGTALPDVPVVHVDLSAEAIGRYHRADAPVVGDALLVTEALVGLVQERGVDAPLRSDAIRCDLADFSVDVEFDDESTTRTVDPRVLMRRLDALLPADRVVVPDVGNAFGFVTPLLGVSSPAHYRLSTNFAAIGLGVATAIGAAVSRPQLTTVGVVGDGALLMVLGELETIAREDVPLVVLCLNDHAYGAEKHFLDLSGVPSGQTVFPDADLAAVAEQFGFEARTIRSIADLEAAADLLISPTGPVLLDCKITPTVLAPFLTTH